MREFNVTGLCLPARHYMADISGKVAQVMQLVEKGKYFTINRARQYGKTTTLNFLDDELVKRDYTVARISFEGIGDEPFENATSFCQCLVRLISREFKDREYKDFPLWEENNNINTFEELDVFLNNACKDKKIVLMIDETDKTSNNMVFLRFIGMLRDKYLQRDKPNKATFQSVILAGVYKPEPWNIAASFKVDMSLSEAEIASMLIEYEKDHKTGMDIEVLSKEIRTYTNGYPYLVSRICQRIDEKLDKNWTLEGLQKAVKFIIIEQSTLFDDMFKNIKSNSGLRDLLYSILINGRSFTFNSDNPGMEFGILQQENDKIAIHNRIFEIRITNYFATEKEISDSKLMMRTVVSSVVSENKLNMALLIEKFANHYYEIYNNKSIDFLEKECRLLFITYLRPYINGVGFYHIESETRDGERMDVIVDYSSEQFIVELKLWYGDAAHEKAYEQLFGYLDSKNKDTGYLLTFDFRKTKNASKPKIEWVEYKGKKILDVIVGF